MSDTSPHPIPMVDLTAQYPLVRDAIDQGLAAALDEARFILGPGVQAFEAEAADYLGCAHAVGVASGTDALHLALLGAGIGPGDEVITTPFSFIATAEAICYTGARPVFADIDARTFNLDPEAVAAAIGPRTRAIVPVHLFGQPADMPRLQTLAEDHGLLLIEDCAQSFGAEIDGNMTGSLGTTGAFSFFPSKNLGGYGDGGLVTTQDEAIAGELRALRNHGSRRRYYHDRIGYNSRLDELQAVILRAKLPHIDRFNAGRRRIAHRYSEGLGDLPGLITPHEDGIGAHVYHQYTLLCDDRPGREALMERLTAEHIASAVYYPVPLHQQAAFGGAEQVTTMSPTGPGCPMADSVAERCLSLPMYPEMPDADVERVIEVIRR
ncbi:DegT/DnrJ/EryC1/StrS family aminotransferase [Spiribacter onubensis]|uniref:DegT/DnrJ/EryC1/StrS family aminotransferase n=1 Tax=Spiribacter onubensis TaxID=3122420 RepID=A0ABV3S7Q1_9GAMM